MLRIVALFLAARGVFGADTTAPTPLPSPIPSPLPTPMPTVMDGDAQMFLVAGSLVMKGMTVVEAQAATSVLEAMVAGAAGVATSSVELVGVSTVSTGTMVNYEMTLGTYDAAAAAAALAAATPATVEAALRDVDDHGTYAAATVHSVDDPTMTEVAAAAGGSKKKKSDDAAVPVILIVFIVIACVVFVCAGGLAALHFSSAADDEMDLEGRDSAFLVDNQQKASKDIPRPL